MTFEKLKSGSYRVKQMYKGKVYAVTVKHKPTQKEATIMLAEKMKQFHETKKSSGSFEDEYRQYAGNRSNVCSPVTLLNYNDIVKNMPEWFRKMNIYEIQQSDVQRLINDYAEEHSPKSVRNLHGLVSSVLKYIRPEVNLRTKLPAVIHVDPYIPSREEVRAILQEVKGTEFEVAFYLATKGLRRGEICALTVDDLDAATNRISITKSKVLTTETVVGRKGKPVQKWETKKTPKTDASNRKITVSDHIRDLILEQGFIYKSQRNPGDLFKVLRRVQKKLKLPEDHQFGFHKFRHYFATQCHAMGIPGATIAALGGWKDVRTVEKIYQHAMPESVVEGEKLYSEMIDNLLAG